jgi:hypothetical protein
MRMTEALRQVAENVQEMKKDRTGNPTTMKDAEKEAVKKTVSKIKSTGMSYSDWEKTTTFGPRLKQAVKMQVEEVDLDEEAFKPDDIVIPKIGPHKGKKHRIIAVKSDNRYTIAPVDIPVRSIQYRLGAATANASDLTKYVKEDLDEEWIDVEEAVNMLEEGKSSTGYDLYHKDFSSAMQHAYDFAKKKYGITIDPEEIDSKVASGPKKPSEGKTNSYSLKGDKGIVQIQVYNKGGSKPYELNMYKS